MTSGKWCSLKIFLLSVYWKYFEEIWQQPNLPPQSVQTDNNDFKVMWCSETFWVPKWSSQGLGTMLPGHHQGPSGHHQEGLGMLPLYPHHITHVAVHPGAAHVHTQPLWIFGKSAGRQALHQGPSLPGDALFQWAAKRKHTKSKMKTYGKKIFQVIHG